MTPSADMPDAVSAQPAPAQHNGAGRQPLIEFRGVSKRFGSKVVLDAVDLSIYEGEVTTIIGKSGVGKSVLLKHIIGLLAPDEGAILFRGTDIRRLKGEERRQFKRLFSYMFQNNALFDSMTVFENIALPLKEKLRLPDGEVRKRVLAKMEQLDLGEVTDKYPSQLSGGMQKRVALARALITDPAIVLFDEPTTGLDPIRKNAVLSMIAHYQRRFGFTAILVSHDIPDVFYISNRVIILYDAKIIYEGKPTRLEQLDHPLVEEFTHSVKALEDELTGLATRRRFERRFSAEFQMTAKDNRGVSVILFSIDNLGAVDEHIGHIAAQHILQTLASVINRHIGSNGYSTRYGQEDILTVLPGVSMDEAGRLLDEISADLGKQDIVKFEEYPKHCYLFTIMAGVVPGEPGIDLAELVARARARREVLVHMSCGGKPLQRSAA